MSSAMFPLHIVQSSVGLEKSTDGLGVNKPLRRHHTIHDALVTAQGELGAGGVVFHTVQAPHSNLHAAQLVHDEGFVTFMETAWQRWEELGDKRDLYFALDCTRSSGDTSGFVPSQIGARDDVQEPGKSVLGQMCYYAMDRMTPITRDTRAQLEWDLAVVEESVNLLSTGAGRNVYAATIQPGHHASALSYGGYCFINNAAVAARMLQQSGQFGGKVGVLDVDYHAGNGTFSIFYTDPSVYVVSIHADPDIEYPYTSGFAHQTGKDAGAGSTLNIPLPKDTTWQQYSVHLKAALDKLVSYGVGALVVSLGVDTIAHDPEASPLAGFLLYPPDYTELGAMIRSVNLPTIWIQEGGYKLDEVHQVVRRTLVGNLKTDESK